LWVATLGGVSVFDGESFTNYTTQNGLASNTVMCLSQDRLGFLWFATWGGINRYDGEVFQTLDRQDGMASHAVMAATQDRQNRLWFGTQNGVTCYRPPAPSPSPIFIRAVVADRRYTQRDEVVIPASAGLIACEFHGINFKTRPGAMVYRHRLQGLEEAWQMTHARRVEYTDLAPGQYCFQVSAVDRDLNYSMPAQICLQVVPDQRDEKIDALEERVQERTRELEEKKATLEKTLGQLRQTQEQLVVQEKMAALGDLVAGIAHELNSPLDVVKSSADVSSRGLARIRGLVNVEQMANGTQFERIFTLLENNNQGTDQAIERLNKIVESLKNFIRLDEAEYQQIDIHVGLETTLTLLEHEFKDRITVDRNYGEIPPIYGYPSELNQVFINLLRNAG
jgi:signal transduction histidine kinase